MRRGQAMSHGDKDTCCGEVRARCEGVKGKVKNVLTAHVVRPRSCVWLSRSRRPVTVAAGRRLCLPACLLYTGRFHSTEGENTLEMRAIMEDHNNNDKGRDEQYLQRFSFGILRLQSAHVCRPARDDLRCDAIADFGPAEAKFKQGLNHAHRYWLATVLPPARPGLG